MKGVCYCQQTGGTSQCVAGIWDNQRHCDFYSKHSFNRRCTHLCPDYGNHCWSFKAQDFSKVHGVVRVEEIGEAIPVESTDILDLSELLDESMKPACASCMWNPCTALINMKRAAQLSGSTLSEQEISDIAAICGGYIDGSTL